MEMTIVCLDEDVTPTSTRFRISSNSSDDGSCAD